MFYESAKWASLPAWRYWLAKKSRSASFAITWQRGSWTKNNSVVYETSKFKASGFSRSALRDRARVGRGRILNSERRSGIIIITTNFNAARSLYHVNTLLHPHILFLAKDSSIHYARFIDSVNFSFGRVIDVWGGPFFAPWKREPLRSGILEERRLERQRETDTRSSPLSLPRRLSSTGTSGWPVASRATKSEFPTDLAADLWFEGKVRQVADVGVLRLGHFVPVLVIAFLKWIRRNVESVGG